jgi:signal transduction histidine kinase/CheY-like chemotaxis protein
MAIMNRSSLASLIGGFLLLIVILVAVAGFTLVLQQSGAEVRANFAMSLALRDLLVATTDAETGQRGYLLTNDERYLAPYDAAQARIARSLDDLQAPPAGAELTASLPELRDAIGDKLKELADTIALNRSGARDAALDIVRSDRGKRIMDHIGSVLAGMEASQRTALAAALAWRDRVAAGLQLAVGAAALGIIALAIFATWDARQRLLALKEQSRLAGERSLVLEATNARLVAESKARAAAEAQVRQIQKMEAIGQLAGGIAHDFNNMLTVVIGGLDLILRRLKRGSGDVIELAESANEAAKRAAELTRRLLAFSRQQPLSPAELDANKVVADMSELIRRAIGEDVRLETIFAGGLWGVRVDRGELESSILNLAVNCRDAMPEGGRITIETANCHLDDGYVRDNPGAAPGQYVLVAISDSGVGMPHDVVERAFDPFFTTKPPGRGTGLGLSQVFGFVKQSGGHIKIYSEVGRGTTVKLYLPRLANGGKAMVAAKPAPPPTLPGAAGEIILLVEDETRARALAAESLREIGYRVIAAESGAEALRLFDQNPGVALLLTDVVMPEMDGRRLADELKRRRAEIKVLFMTGFSRNAVIHNGVLDPGVNLLAKPFTIDMLATKVRQALDG